MNAHSIFRVISPYFRKQRMAQFLSRMKPGPATRILDAGGYPSFWVGADISSAITILNLRFPPGLEKECAGRFTLVEGDATQMAFRDRQFDIVFSNSVIEHLETYGQQERFAAEVRRTGKDLWVQTPAKSFFLEPHLLTPFIHWFPKATQLSLARYFTFWGWITRPSKEAAFQYVNELRLLTEAEMQTLFPDCEIRKERFCGMTKSYIAIRQKPA